MPWPETSFLSARVRLSPRRKELEKGITGPARGPADAPVTIVEFSDLQCPHCKEAQPVFEKLMAEEPNVRLVFQNFPLAIPAHDWAAKGAAYADCMGASSNDAFWKFIHGVYRRAERYYRRQCR